MTTFIKKKALWLRHGKGNHEDTCTKMKPFHDLFRLKTIKLGGKLKRVGDHLHSQVSRRGSRGNIKKG